MTNCDQPAPASAARISDEPSNLPSALIHLRASKKVLFTLTLRRERSLCVLWFEVLDTRQCSVVVSSGTKSVASVVA